MKTIGLYFSGTGNSKFAVERFIEECKLDVPSYSIEDSTCLETIEKADTIVLSYPIYYSCLPLILKDFINEHAPIWKDKNIYIIATMGLFSGDGSGLSARLLKSYGANIIGASHMMMSDNIIDVKVFVKNKEKMKKTLNQAMKRIEDDAKAYMSGNAKQTGLSFPSRLAGLFAQRLWFGWMSNSYKDKPKIDHATCVRCNHCVKLCPMNNLHQDKDGNITHDKKCTMCYRCVHECPTQSITILGKKVLRKENPLDAYQK